MATAGRLAERVEHLVVASDSVVASAIDERTLVRHAMSGDDVAFDALISARLPRLVRVARSILREEAAAHDAVQESCVRAWRQLRGLRDPDAFDAWLMRILVNACRTQLGGRRRRLVREIPIAAEGEAPGELDRHANSAPPLAEGVLDREAVRRAFSRLDAGQRALLVLHYVEDRPLAEIAATLRTPVGTLKWRLSRARAALERALEVER